MHINDESSHSSEYLEDILQEENIFDYDSDTAASGDKDHEPDTSASREPLCIAPNPFLKRSTAQVLTALRFLYYSL